MSRATAYGPAPTLVDHLPSLGLPDVMGEAALQTRVDRKYVLTLSTLEPILRSLPDDVGVLEIDDRRDFGYSTVYFDTADLACFRHHVQGRRHRAKVRTRLYTDSADCVLEVKVKGAREETVKHRTAWDSAAHGALGSHAQPFLRAHAPALADLTLHPSAVTSYSRTTLLDRRDGTRITIDAGLVMRLAARRAAIRADRVLVETKTLGRSGRLDRALRAAGARPVSLSKYCLAVPLLHDGQRGNRWNRVLRRDFGWTPPAAP